VQRLSIDTLRDRLGSAFAEAGTAAEFVFIGGDGLVAEIER
jgi:hypothetical protein